MFRPIAASALAGALLLAAAPAPAQDGDGPQARPAAAGGDVLAIYQDDLALVTTARSVALEPGTAQLQIDRISPGIVSGSLDVAAPGLRVTRQELAPWPLNRRRLLEAYLGREVTLVRPAGDDGQAERVPATLLSIADGLVLRVDGRIETDPPGRIVFPELPDSLPTGPRADIRVSVSEGGQRTLELRYLTKGLTWTVDYLARYDAEAGRIDLTGMAAIDNDLPVAIGAERVKLLAGQVSQAARDRRGGAPERALQQVRSARAKASVPQPQSRSDLKVYPLPEPLDLPAGGSVQVPLIQAQDIRVDRQYRLTGLATAAAYRGRRGPTSAQLRLRIPDTARAGLGQALPAGTLRVTSGDLYRGAQDISDTPLGRELTIDLGRAFDVTAEARQTAFEQLGERTYETAQEVAIENAKDRAVTVQVLGSFPADWEMRSESHPHDARDVRTPVWTLDVPAGGETVLTYRVRVWR
jgi:hypothetical protein